jgi:hypothetical protein
MTKIDVRRLSNAKMGDWLKAKHAAHLGDPAFIAPLNLFEARRISLKHSPFFDHGSAEFFIAFIDGRAVGRISAQINERDPGFVNEKIGHFGFFDVIDDEIVARSLIDAACKWLAEKGCVAIRGPFNLSINEECGCQVSGFETAPSYLMAQSRPWTGRFLETSGFAKAVDMLAYRSTPAAIQEGAQRIANLAAQFKDISVRPIRRKSFNDEVKLLADIFNDSWSANWGFIPFSPREIDLLAAELKLIYRPTYGFFAEIKGKPVGVFAGVPNINEVIAPFNGRLTPFNLFKLGWTLYKEGIRTSRIPFAGLRRQWQSGFQGAALMAALANATLVETRRREVDWFEFSWILEHNKPAIKFVEQLGGVAISRYRIYHRII